MKVQRIIQLTFEDQGHGYLQLLDDLETLFRDPRAATQYPALAGLLLELKAPPE